MIKKEVIMKLYKLLLIIVFFIGGFHGCSIKPKVLKPDGQSTKHKHVIFFDGTANAEASDTNIKKLHSLISLQNKKDIGTIYIEGVGANGKLVGMATGWGIGHRVRLAYEYLLQNYKVKDRIYIFGFSRGAYSARILSSLLYYGGLPTKKSSKEEAKMIAEKIYDAYKGKMTKKERKLVIKDTVQKNNFPKLHSTNVHFLGLWDTVEALGRPDYKENYLEVNERYGDQLCNVNKAAHALALDDNRARIFTPILLTRNYLLEDCDRTLEGEYWKPSKVNIIKRLNNTVEEVWFTGAHFDVGGGYPNSLLGGVSLNWMMKQIKNVDKSLLPKRAMVRYDASEPVHDPEAGLLWGTLYKEQWRNLKSYTNGSLYNNGRLKIHYTTINRLKKPEKKTSPKDDDRMSQWRLVDYFRSCFEKRNVYGGFDYNHNEKCQLESIK